MLAFIQDFPLYTFLLLQSDSGQVTPEQFQSGSSLLWMFVQTLFALGFVCLLAYFVLRIVLPRLNVGKVGKSMVQVVDRIPLDQRRSLYVIEVTGRWLLIAASEGGVELISELDAEKAEEEAAAVRAAAPSLRARETLSQAKVTARSTFEDVLARMNNRRQ